MRERAATTSWGVAALVAIAVPLVSCRAGAHPPAKPAAAAAAPVPFTQSWAESLASAGPLTIAADAASIFVAGFPGATVARTAADGRVLWSEPIVPSGAPMVANRLIFAVVDGRLHALDAVSGSDRWPFDVEAGPVPPTVQGDWVVVPASTGIGAYHAADGSAVWQRALGAFASGPAAVDGDRVFVALSDGRLVALDLETGDVLWTTWLVTAPSGLLAANALLYFGSADGRIFAYSQDRGAYKWAHRIESDAAGAPATDGRRIFIASRDSVVWALDASNGNQRWRVPLDDRPSIGPWIDGSDLVVALITGEVDLIDAKSGRASGKIDAPPPAALATGLIKFPARLQGISSPVPGEIVRLTLDPDRGSTLAVFKRETPPAK